MVVNFVKAEHQKELSIDLSGNENVACVCCKTTHHITSMLISALHLQHLKDKFIISYFY